MGSTAPVGVFPYTGLKHIIIISVRFSTVDKKLVDHTGMMNMNFNFTFKQTSSSYKRFPTTKNLKKKRKMKLILSE